MIEVTLQQIQEWIPCDIDSQYLRQTIKGVTIDSRAIKTNMLFIPFKGENVDGHRFVSQALKDGVGLLSMKRAMTLMITWRDLLYG